jgi:hypothetical protein
MRRRALAITAAAVSVLAAACSHDVDGTARRAHPTAPDPDRDYGYTDNRCGLLTDGTIEQTLGGHDISRPYSGAVCQFVMSRDDGVVDVTFSWFESGNLDRERAVAVERGAHVSSAEVARHDAFTARRDVTGAACSATAAGGAGVLSWWVQYRGQLGGSGGDPCVAAQKLLDATLTSDM